MELNASVAVRTADDDVLFRLTVRNDGERPLELRFESGQTAEFVVTGDGEPVWQWSDGRMFTQQIRHETLSPGDETTAEGRWSDPPAGRYTVEATLTDADERPTAETTFEV